MNSTVDHNEDLIPARKYNGVLKEGGWYFTALRKSLKLNDNGWRLFLQRRARDNQANRWGFTSYEGGSSLL